MSVPSIPSPVLDSRSEPAAEFPSLPVGSSAVVYCEGQFNEQDGKTANGLVRHSEKYDILSIIDSRLAGLDAGTVLDGEPNGIPVVAGLGEAIVLAGRIPDYLICGLAPADGLLSADQRVVLLDGIARGMHVINGLHEFLNDDAEFVAASLQRRRDHHRRPPAQGQEGPASVLRAGSSRSPVPASPCSGRTGRSASEPRRRCSSRP